MNPPPGRRLAKSIVAVIAVAIVYYAAARVGLLLAFDRTNASPVWPPSGIALAAVLLLGRRVWPGVALGAFFANASVFFATRPAGGATIVVVSALIAVGNTLEALAGRFLLDRLVGARSPLDRARDLFKFVAAAVVMCLVSAGIGPTSLAVWGVVPWAVYGTVWFTWWLGDVTGVLVATPLVLSWNRRSGITWTPPRLVEAGVLFVLLAVSGRVGFGGWIPGEDAHYPLAFIAVPFFVWAAFRFEQREIASCVAILSAIAVWDTVHGFGPFVRATIHESLLLLQIFVGVVAVTIFAMGALMTERREAETQLRHARDELEIRARERTAEVVAANESLRAEVVEHQRAQEALRAGEERLRAIVETATDAIVSADSRGNIIAFNPSAERILGYRASDVIGRPLTVLMPERFHDRHVEGLRRFLATSESRVIGRTVELTGRRRDGSEFPLELSLAAWKAGDETFFTGIIRDITERKRTEAAAREAREEAERANRLKSEFLANVSHEIRTPLNVIFGYSRLLQKRAGTALDEDLRTFLNHIQEAGQRLMATVQKLIDISRFHIEDFRLRPEPLLLGEVVAKCVESVRVLAEQKGLALTLETKSPEPWIVADPYAVTQALTNVIENAIKYTPTGGVDVGVRRVGDDRVTVWVRDTGVGVSEEFLARLFDEFTQEDAGYGRPVEGTGLGLALAKKFVEASGGSITVESAKGRGSTFRLSFPVAAGGILESGVGPGPRVAAAATEAPAEARVPILLVEDDAATQELMRSAFGEGFVLHMAASADEARAILAREPVRLVVMDLSIRGPIDGLQLTRQLRSSPRWHAVPIIALTAHAYNHDREAALAAGCDAYLAKPIDPDGLLETAARLLRRA